MRRLSLLFAVPFVVPLFGSGSPKEFDDKTETVGIEGTWRLTEREIDGKKTKPDLQCFLTFRDRTFTFKDSDGDTFRGRSRIDLTQKPALLDCVPANGPYKGQTLKSIYHIDGDTLKIAFSGLKTIPRPQGFNVKDIVVYTFKRVK